MNSKSLDFLKKIYNVNYHKQGIKSIDLYKVNNDFFTRLQNECLNIIDNENYSEVKEKEHITNWTKPLGKANQFSLFNTTGDFSDFSSDHNLSTLNKRFHHSDKFPVISEFIDMFPSLINMRMNVMFHKSGLSLHEEHIVHKDVDGNYFMRVRFHLPIVSSKKAIMHVDGSLYNYEESSIYFFNNGGVHSAMNQCTKNKRVHLVWDMLLTEDTYNTMFSGGLEVGSFVNKITVPIGVEKIKDYQLSGRMGNLYSRFKLSRLGIKRAYFGKLYSAINYFIPRKLKWAPNEY